MSNVSKVIISRLERGEELKPATVATIRAALETAGVEFISENGGGAGVRLVKFQISIALAKKGSACQNAE